VKKTDQQKVRNRITSERKNGLTGGRNRMTRGKMIENRLPYKNRLFYQCNFEVGN
jgi:hypothetical protein